MAHIITDDTFAKLKEIADTLLSGKPLSPLRQVTYGGIIHFLLDQSLPMEAPDLDARLAAIKAKIDTKEGMLIEASEAFNDLLKALTNEHGGVVMSKINGVPWFFVDELAPELAGIIPTFLDVEDKRSVIKQLDAAYVGGWHRMEGWELNTKSWAIRYVINGEVPDPPLHPIGGTALNGDTLAIYPDAWVMVVNGRDNHFEIARMD